MRVILYSILLVFLFVFAPTVQADMLPKTIYAVSNNNVLEENLCEGHVLYLHTIDTYELSDNEYIEKDSTIKVKIKEHIQPKRGKRNGYLKVQVLSYTIPSKKDTLHSVSNREIDGTLRLSTPKDLKNIAKSAGISIVGKILKFPGFSQAVAVSKGLIKPNDDQNRLQSAGTNLYKSTPLVFTEKGKDISIEEDTIVVIKVKI